MKKCFLGISKGVNKSTTYLSLIRSINRLGCFKTCAYILGDIWINLAWSVTLQSRSFPVCSHKSLWKTNKHLKMFIEWKDSKHCYRIFDKNEETNGLIIKNLLYTSTVMILSSIFPFDDTSARQTYSPLSACVMFFINSPLSCKIYRPWTVNIQNLLLE